MQEAMRCIATGRPMRRQGAIAARSSRRESPLGEIMAFLYRAMNIAAPPATYDMAVATAAPSTPQPAPSIVNVSPNTDTVRVA